MRNAGFIFCAGCVSYCELHCQPLKFILVDIINVIHVMFGYLGAVLERMAILSSAL